MIFWFEKHNKLSWVITILIAIVIFYISSLSFKGAPLGGFGWKTIIYHFYAFFFLSAFLLISLIKGKPKKKKIIPIAIIIAILYGILDEIHQVFVSGRTFSILDILTNSAGILLVGYLYLMILLGKNMRLTSNM